MTQNPDLVIFKNLIAYYVQRQRLVVLALLDIDPALLAWTPDRGLPQRASIFGIDLEPYIEAHAVRINTNGVQQSGIWKHDWRYWQHGIGCRLTHIQTEEVLEWDAPDPDAFDIDWFFDHLEWRLEHEPDDPFVKGYAPYKMPFNEFRFYLIQSGLIQRPEDSSMYKLTHS